jgi:hypothetical protein
MQGKTESPRLETARKLCRLYGISLDYFDLPTEEACRAYLARRRQQIAPASVQEIAALSEQLSLQGKRNILAILRWIQLGNTAPLPSLQN